MPPLSIGPVALGKIPRIIAVFDRVVPAAEAARVHQLGAGLAEIRFDLLNAPFEQALAFAKALRASAPFGIIGTLRETPQNKAARLDMFKKLIPLVDGIDIELEAQLRPEIILAAAGKTIIVSHHDFEKMPLEKDLIAISNEARKAGADIVKIAGTAKRTEDTNLLLNFCGRATYPMIAVVMGDAAGDARIEALKKGSIATYAFTGSVAVAPGQRSVADMAAKLREIFPAFKTGR
jgi:3-dehydroquinate dehydratase type I